MLTELSRGETRDALQELGIRVPAGAREDALAAEYFDCFVHPEAGAPPVASLWIDGDYGGSCRRDIERWAESVGFSFEPQSELAPVPDHLGSLLLLWAELYPRQPEQAAELAAHLQQWAPRALARPAQGKGFYAEVSRGLIDYLDLTSSFVAAAAQES
jgi:TorA maturation chaperone TorD